jgi:hypothetical protein
VIVICDKPHLMPAAAVTILSLLLLLKVVLCPGSE